MRHIAPPQNNASARKRIRKCVCVCICNRKRGALLLRNGRAGTGCQKYTQACAPHKHVMKMRERAKRARGFLTRERAVLLDLCGRFWGGGDRTTTTTK